MHNFQRILLLLRGLIVLPEEEEKVEPLVVKVVKEKEVKENIEFDDEDMDITKEEIEEEDG